MRDYAAIVETARVHYENLKKDIDNSKDRIEHIRLTALAQEAHNLLIELEVFQIGLVYTHTAASVPPRTDVASEPLDLPEFKSPYTPPLRLE